MIYAPAYEVAEPRTLEITKEMEQKLANDYELDLEVDSIHDIPAKEVLEFFDEDTCGLANAEWDGNEITYNYESDYHYEY